MKFIRKYLRHKAVRYGLVGGTSTLIHIIAAYSYLYMVNNSVVISNVVGFFSAFSFSYIVQSKFVFKHTISRIKALKYFIVQFVSLLIAISISNYVPLQDSYLKVIAVIIILPLITYLIHSIWTFSEPKIKQGKESRMNILFSKIKYNYIVIVMLFTIILGFLLICKFFGFGVYLLEEFREIKLIMGYVRHKCNYSVTCNLTAL